MKKRIMSLALVVAIFVGAFGVRVFAADDTGVQKSLASIENSVSLSTAHNKFKDVDSNDWFYDDVDYAYGYGLVHGTSDSTFEPSATMTRAMLATVIYRMFEGWGGVDPADVGSDYFTDLNTSEYYYEGVTWCYNVGIVHGTGDHTFSPNDSVTREQAAKMIGILYMMVFDFSKEVIPTTNYTDQGKISDWAIEYVNLLSYCATMTGYPDGTFLPGNTITRAEATKIVTDFHFDVEYSLGLV